MTPQWQPVMSGQKIKWPQTRSPMAAAGTGQKITSPQMAVWDEMHKGNAGKLSVRTSFKKAMNLSASTTSATELSTKHSQRSQRIDYLGCLTCLAHGSSTECQNSQVFGQQEWAKLVDWLIFSWLPGAIGLPGLITQAASQKPLILGPHDCHVATNVGTPNQPKRVYAIVESYYPTY